MPIVKISHHLRVLRNAQVVRTEKHGKFIVYSLEPEIAGDQTQCSEKTLDFGCCRIDLLQPKVIG
jgi:hypothetical protein